MERKDIMKMILSNIQKIRKDIRVIHENDYFLDDLGLDSLDILMLITDCEKEMNTVFPDDLWEAKTVGEFVDLIQNY